MSDELRQLEIYMPDIHCADCARDLINGVILNKTGIKEASFDEKKFILSISFDEKLINEDNIKHFLSDAGLKGHVNKEGFADKENKNRLINSVIIVIIVIILIVFIWWTKNL